MTAPTVVVAQGLGFDYDDRPILDGVDLEVAAGKVFGVVGADGAGKSTLLRLLIGQLKPRAGAVSVLGRPAHDLSLRSQIAYMPQGFGQYLDLSVGENLAFFADLHGVDRAASQSLIHDLLLRTGLAEFRERRAGQLSGGMMQKLALACALVSRPRVMFLDEPTTGVDPVSRRAFWQLIDQVRAEDVGIVYATANMDEAERCDEVGLLVAGRFVRQGAPLDLINEVDAPLLEVSGDEARAKRREVRQLPNVALVLPVGSTLKVWLGHDRDQAPFAAALASVAPSLLPRRLRPTLHDVALRDLALASEPGRAGAT